MPKKPADKPASRTPAASTAEEKAAPPAEAPKAEAGGPKADEKATAEAVKRIEDLGGTLKRDASGQVTGVDLEMCQTKDSDLEVLAALPSIQKLNLWGADITDGGVKHLKKLPKLVDLTLFNTDLTDKGVEQLKDLTTLKSLNLRRTTNMTDAAIAHITQLPNLQYLYLLYNNIGDDALAASERHGPAQVVGPSRLHDGGRQPGWRT